MSEPKRLHPATIIFNLINSVKDMFFLFVIAFVTLVNIDILYAISAVVAIFVLLIVASYISWKRFTYRVEGNELKLEYGVIIRKKRYISKNRIQSIDLTQNILHRIFKLVKVEIETAGTGKEAEASLNTVTFVEGEALRSELKSSITENESAEELKEEKETPTVTITRKRLILAGATSGSLGVLLAVAGAAFSEMVRFIPTNFYDSAYTWLVGLGIVVMGLMALGGILSLWLLGIVGVMMKYWNFTIAKVEEDIVITCGLIEKKIITIPLKRIQAVGYVENLIRQPLGYVTVIVEIAGGSNEKGEDFSTVLFPIMKKKEVDGFLAKLLPEYRSDDTELIQLPKRSLKYYLVRAVIIPLLVLGAVLYMFPQFVWIPSVVFVWSVFLGVLQYKDSAYRIMGNKLFIRYRNFNKVTMMMYHKRIQAFNKKQHILHKRDNLATIQLSIVGKMGQGKHYHVKELDIEDADTLADWYSYRGG